MPVGGKVDVIAELTYSCKYSFCIVCCGTFMVWACVQITVLLYELLEVVDRASDHLHHMDTITDFLYPLISYIIVIVTICIAA